MGAATVSSGTTIERVEVETLSLPLHTPFVTALRRATTAESVVVRVTDSDGRIGLGEAPQNWQVLGSSVAEGLSTDSHAGSSVRCRRKRPSSSRTSSRPGPSRTLHR